MLESLFVIFLLSGIIKGYFEYYNIQFPIDFTLFSIIFVLLFFTLRVIFQSNYKLYLSKRNFYVLAFSFLFWIWMAFSLIYTQSTNYSYSKTYLFGTILLTIVIIAFGGLDIRKVIKSFIIYNYILLILFFPVLYEYQKGIISDAMTKGISNLYLTLGENLGIIILLLKFNKYSIFKSNIDKYFIYISFLLLIIIGARGPLIFAILIFILYYVISYKDNNKFSLKISLLKVLIGVFGLLLFIYGIIYFHNEINTLFDRSLSRLFLVFDSNSSSISQRLEHLTKSWNLLQSPITFIRGIGIGSYSLLTTGIDTRGYPHNIFLEVLVELGIIGLIIFILIFLSLIYYGKRNKYISMFVLLFIFLNMLKSSSLVDTRIYFAFFVLYHNEFEFNSKNRLFVQNTLPL